MAERPTLQTERLRLRQFALSDAPEVQRLAGAWEIARMTGTIEHPYPDGAAESWISSHQERFDRGEDVVWAIERLADGVLVGAMALDLEPGDCAELGYWIGVPYWGQGYCTEAARAVLHYGFTVRGLRRIHACHFGSNPASGRVMQKIGMAYEGCLRQHRVKWQFIEDDVHYGILREEHGG